MTPWQELSDVLRALLAQCDEAGGAPADLMKFAQNYQRFAETYVRAVAHAGRTSMRAEAAAKALDLRTPKSALLSFLGRDA